MSPCFLFLFVSHVRPTDLIVLDYQCHLLQRSHSVCYTNDLPTSRGYHLLSRCKFSTFATRQLSYVHTRGKKSLKNEIKSSMPPEELHRVIKICRLNYIKEILQKQYGGSQQIEKRKNNSHVQSGVRSLNDIRDKTLSRECRNQLKEAKKGTGSGRLFNWTDLNRQRFFAFCKDS